MTKWLVTGTWDFDSRPGKVTVVGETMRDAFEAAKVQGLSATEAIVSGDTKTRTAIKQTRANGLSRGEAWAVIAVGIIISPLVVGIPLLIWGILSLRRLGESD